MKRIFAVFFLMVLLGMSLPGLSKPWTGEDLQVQAVEERDKEIYSLVPFVLHDEVVRVSIDNSAYKDAKGAHREQVFEYVEWLYQQWFQTATHAIRQAGREEDFTDILPVLERGIKLEFTYENEEEWERTTDIRFLIFPNLNAMRRNVAKEMEEKKDNALLGHYMRAITTDPMEIRVAEDSGEEVWLHEIGHSLGFKDEYGWEENSRESVKYRSFAQPEKSAMRDGKNKITCLDTEGLVNLFDAWRVHEEKYYHPENWPEHLPARIVEGWEGYCSNEQNEKEFYVLGSSLKALQQQELDETERALVEAAGAARVRNRVKKAFGR